MKLLREPLVQFFALGAGIFLLFHVVRGPAPDPPERIVVSAAQVERLRKGWARTWQRPPTPQELEALVEDHIREEILYREGLALGLDRDDAIVRRRLRQKMEFLSEDLSASGDPREEELRRFLEEHAAEFRIEPQLSFRHVYLNPEQRGEAIGRDAERLLGELRDAADAGEPVGDPLPLPDDFEAAPESEVAGLFGRAFAGRLLALEPGRWVGPVESSYGLHLVFVRERSEARLPELDEARDAVQREWLTARRRAANEAVYRRLRSRYQVSVERPGAGSEHAGESR